MAALRLIAAVHVGSPKARKRTFSRSTLGTIALSHGHFASECQTGGARMLVLEKATQLVDRDRQITHGLAGHVVDGVGYGGGSTDYAKFAGPLTPSGFYIEILLLEEK
ncbi:hypothetical protein NKJ23_21115 [Mesorhizobium sp. M0184]|uniref:hypothetical protein n=1 Tax=Mesorhizobium sp. M0184 TaxID=2956906 RepID=UPI003339D899